MAATPARVLVIARHPALEGLAPALRARGVDARSATALDEIEWLLHSWERRCVAVLDATLLDAALFARLRDRLHARPAVPTLIVFDERYQVSPRELAPGDAYVYLPATLEDLSHEVGWLLVRAGYPAPWLTENPVAPPRPRGRGVVVFSLKGGVGRSTIAANLAVSLARHHGQSVVLVDADLWRGDQAVLLDLRLGRGMAALVPRGNEVLDLDALRAALQSHRTGVRLLPAPDEPALVEAIPPELPARLVESCKTEADYVVVDTPPALDDLTLYLFDIADRVLVVFTPEVSAVRHTVRLLRLAPDLGLQERLLLVLNRANSGLALDQIETLLERRIDAQLVSAGRAVLDAANRGRTLVEADSKLAEPITRDFTHLAALVHEQVPPPRATAAPRRPPLPRAVSELGAVMARHLRRGPTADPAPPAPTASGAEPG